jgi:hypothetical protein
LRNIKDVMLREISGDPTWEILDAADGNV